MAKIFKTGKFKGTWLGKPGESTTYHLDSKVHGLRVTVLALEGAPTLVELIEGDGRYGGDQFKRIRSAQVSADLVESTVAEFVQSI